MRMTSKHVALAFLCFQFLEICLFRSLCLHNTVLIGIYHCSNTNRLFRMENRLRSYHRSYPPSEFGTWSYTPTTPTRRVVHGRSYQMKLTNALSPLTDLRYAIGASLWPTILDIYHTPSLLFRPAALSQVVMAHIWVLFGNPTDEGGRSTKEALITPNAYGVVLDIGAGVSESTL